jgi:adenosylmethionine-8-amino-7-oxononanoate aminotransferase
MPHVMFGGLTHRLAEELADRLIALLPGRMQRVFFSESGSVAVEVAMKMALQFRLNRGESGRTKFLAFRGAYHGDTLGAMSLCDPAEGMHARLGPAIPQQIFADLPRSEDEARALEALVESNAESLTAIVIEPLAQGAGGMMFHGPETLRRVAATARRHGLLLIADEIFTGFGRTGALFACAAAEIEPDIICLSKALTGGVLPLAATIAAAKVCDAFWDDDPGKALMHGPTFMANPLACAAALASLDLFAREPRVDEARKLEVKLASGLRQCANLPGVRNVRALGAIGVVELDQPVDRAALGHALLAHGVWIRPLGGVLYLAPALNISDADLETLCNAVYDVLSSRG